MIWEFCGVGSGTVDALSRSKKETDWAYSWCIVILDLIWNLVVILVFVLVNEQRRGPEDRIDALDRWEAETKSLEEND
ncbi:hypothetical protein M8C21_029825 [Ambrosia artemisiifolia]|uniref:Uncharacterized protein n=1 Tax=Ambrosia artemisiifolia TaxID=4212 RepID=A0AAD5G918_AMBAR|nr:hypothetical protein M8C21_029825 [Ambrosia artemisiifolia]